MISRLGLTLTVDEWIENGHAQVTEEEFQLRMSTGRWEEWEALTTPAKYPDIADWGKIHKMLSCFRGVGWGLKNKKWMVRITVDQRTYTVGYYDTELQAARRYNEVAIKHHGDAAILNDLEAADEERNVDSHRSIPRHPRRSRED